MDLGHSNSRGRIIAEGTPEQITHIPGCFTGEYLRPVLEATTSIAAD